MLKFKILALFIFCSIFSDVYSANRYWIGTGIDVNWSSTANWSATSGSGTGGASVPGVNDIAIFNGDDWGTSPWFTSPDGNCYLNQNIDVAGLWITSDHGNTYMGTIFQGNYTITVGVSDFKQQCATFVGNSVAGAYNINVADEFILSAGTFTSTNDELKVTGNFTHSGGTFTHNSGIVILYGTKTITGNTTGTTFNELKLDPNSSSTYTFAVGSGNIYKTNKLFLLAGTGYIRIDGGTIEIIGAAGTNITIANTYTNGGGSGKIKITGSGNQTISGNNTDLGGALCHVEINKSGTVYLSNTVTIAGDITKTAGSFTGNSGSKLVLTNNTTTTGVLTITGAISAYNLSLQATSAITITLTSSVSCNNSLDISGTAATTINTGYFIVYGANLYLNNTTTGTVGTGAVKVWGYITQTITSAVNAVLLCNLEIEKYAQTAGNTLEVSGNFTLEGDLTINFLVNEEGASYVYKINNGTIKVKGNLNYTSGALLAGGTATIEMIGATARSINGIVSSGGSSDGQLPNLKINKSGVTTTLNDNIPVMGNFTWIAGTVTASSSCTLWMFANGTTNSVLTAPSTSVTLNNIKLGNGTSSGTPGEVQLAASNPISLTGNLEILSAWTNYSGVTTASGKLNCNNNNITLAGNWTNNVAAANFNAGTAVVTFNGSGAQAINGTVASQTFNHVVVAKTAGQTLSVGGSTTTLTTNNFTETSGNFNAPATLNINAGTASTLTLSAGTFTAGANIYITGNWTNNGATYTPGTGTVRFTGTGAQAINGTAASQAFNDVIVAKTAGQTLSVSGSTTTLTTNNFTETTGNFTAPATLNINGGSASTLTLSAGIFTAGANTYITGNWTNNGGTFTPGSGTVNFTGTGAQAINGTAASQAFNHVIVAKTAGQTLSVSGSTTTLTTNDFTETTGNFTAPATLNINAGTASTLTLSAGTFTAGANIYITGDWINNGGTFTPGSNLVTFTGTKDPQYINGSATSQVFYNVVVNKSSGTVAFGGTGTSLLTLTTNNLTLNSGNFSSPVPASTYSTSVLNIGATAGSGADLTISNGTVFTSGATTNIAGDWIVNASGNHTHNDAGVVTFNGSIAQSIQGIGSAYTQSFNSINVVKSAGTLLNVTGTTSGLSLSNDFTLTTGNFTAPAEFEVFGNMTLSSGTLTLDQVTLLSGNWTNNGATFNPNSGAVYFVNQLLDQTISKSSGFETFFNIELAKALNKKLNFTADLIITNSLALSDGILYSTNKIITINHNATVTGGSNTGYVDAAMKKIGNVAFTYPLGSALLSSEAYHPLEITAPTQTTDAFTAQYFGTNNSLGKPAGGDMDNISTCEYWTLARSNGSSDVKGTLYYKTTNCSYNNNPLDMSLAYTHAAQTYWATISPVIINTATNPMTIATSINVPFNSTDATYLTIAKKNITYWELMNEVDGTYDQLNYGKLRFKYDEEYKVISPGKLKFKIYDKQKKEVLSDATVTKGAVFGDNRFEIDLTLYSGIVSGETYLLEVISEKNEKKYLRFKY